MDNEFFTYGALGLAQKEDELALWIISLALIFVDHEFS